MTPRSRRVGGPLVAYAPRLDAVAPRLLLGEFPTPTTEAPSIAAHYGVGRLIVKREDLTSRVYGGAKVRALEFLLGAADAAGASGVATLGPDASHHVFATALFGTAAGFRVRAATFPQPETVDGPRLRARLRELGVEETRAPLAALLWWSAAKARFTKFGDARPTWIAAGGAAPIGVLGAAEAALELFATVDAGGAPPPDAIVVPAGSCATAAGVVLGCALAGRSPAVVAVRVTPRVVASKGRIMRLAVRAAETLRSAGGDARLPTATRAVRLIVDHGRYGPGYALPDAAALAARDVATRDGLTLETTYTAKALSALDRPDLRGRTACFWHTYSAAPP